MAKKATLEKIQETLADLPSSELETVARFIEFLRTVSGGRKKSRRLRQDWAGGLQEFAEKYSSLDLQKLALSWREG